MAHSSGILLLTLSFTSLSTRMKYTTIRELLLDFPTVSLCKSSQIAFFAESYILFAHRDNSKWKCVCSVVYTAARWNYWPFVWRSLCSPTDENVVIEICLKLLHSSLDYLFTWRDSLTKIIMIIISMTAGPCRSISRRRKLKIPLVCKKNWEFCRWWRCCLKQIWCNSVVHTFYSFQLLGSFSRHVWANGWRFDDSLSIQYNRQKESKKKSK